MLRESSGFSNVGAIKIGLVPTGNCNDAAENKFFSTKKNCTWLK